MTGLDLKQRLSRNETVFGMMIRSVPSPAIAQVEKADRFDMEEA